MGILVSQKILHRIKLELSRSTESFLLVSAYCKLPLVEYFDSCIGITKIEKKLIIRFRAEDIACGASDLEIYPYCKQNGWKLYFKLDLHAKTYVFDRVRCILGSANATANGLSLGGNGNYEMATYCELEDEDAKMLKLLLNGSVEMTDAIYKIMQDTLCSISPLTAATWPTEIASLFASDYSILFSEDFPSCPDPNSADYDALTFLNIPFNSNILEIKHAFAQAKCYKWLVDVISKQNSNEIYFGAATARLHDVLLNEPKPYRADVKQLLSNLISWISILKMDEVVVDRPNHSQRVRLQR